jgi:HAD superfamily hydrolase (TIGR01484 family)
MMKPLSEFSKSKINYLFTDIDDTLTDDGKLEAPAYAALWNLHESGFRVVPVTGRPAGWCEMIARFWPVDGVIGENGGLYFRYENRQMKRLFVQTTEQQRENRKKLDRIAAEVLKNVPGSAIASDQFARMLDLAIDFCEDVPPLPRSEVNKIIEIFTKHGAQAKVSSIHVNGWFGVYDKLSMCKTFVQNEFGFALEDAKDKCTFVGDSPNDEPMFAYFPTSFAVANIQNFVDQIRHLPTYVAPSTGGHGFVEIAERLIQLRATTSY